MIVVKKAPAGYIAQLYVEDELTYDVALEQSFQARWAAGEKGLRPPPPHGHYGPGGSRLVRKTFLDETGQWSPTVEQAVATLRSKKLIRAAQARIKRAEEKLAWEQRRLAGLLDPNQRVFDEDSGLELEVKL